MNSGPVHESHDPNFQISSTNPVNMALQTMLIAFLLSSISITLLILHLDFLTYNACQAEVGILDGSRPDTKLIRTLRGVEKVTIIPSIPSSDMEMEKLSGDQGRFSNISVISTQL